MLARCQSAKFCRRTSTGTNRRNKREQRIDEQIESNNTNIRVSTAQLHKSQSQKTPAKRIKQRRVE